GSVLPASRGQHFAVRRPRCEFQDVLGLAAIRLLPAPVLVDQGPVSRLYLTVADSGSAGRHLFPLDAAATGLDRWLVVCAIRHRGSHLVERSLARDRSKCRRLHMEVDAILDRDFPCRSDDNSARYL